MQKRLPREAAVVIALVALFLVAVVFYVLKPGGDEGIKVFGDLIYVAYAGIATIAGLLAIKVYSLRSPQGKMLGFLTLAMFLDLIAGALWAFDELVRGIDAPFPSIADAVWMAFYVVLIAAFWYAARHIWPLLSTPKSSAVFLLWSMLVIVVYFSTFHTIFMDESYSLPLKLLSAAYPIGDLLVLLPLGLLLLELRKGIFGPSLLAFLVAIGTMMLGDLAYSYQIWTGTYATGNLIDLFWYAGQLLMAYGFYLQIRILTRPVDRTFEYGKAPRSRRG